MKLKEKFITDEGEFELVVIKRDELTREHTTANIILEAILREYVLPTKTQAYSIGKILDNNIAYDVVGVWILVSIYKNNETSFFKYGATIVSGILHDNEGSDIPKFGENPNHEWEPGIAFVFIAPTKEETFAIRIEGNVPGSFGGC